MHRACSDRSLVLLSEASRPAGAQRAADLGVAEAVWVDIAVERKDAGTGLSAGYR